MTFSIVGCCADTGDLGIAVSSSSIAVGARCAWARSGVGVVATQNVTLPSLGPQILELLAQGIAPEEALEQARKTDVHNAYRQVTVIDRQGRTALYSGARTLGTFHALAGRQCVAAGNMLASPRVIEAMVSAFEGQAGALGDRLLAAMQAGLAAGGEQGPVHSAAMKIHAGVSWPLADLRVDWTDADPIAALARLWTDYKPQMQDYLVRALDPTQAPSYGVPGDE